MTIDGNLTVFNVDYRNGPECKLPNNINDCYAGLKYIAENAADFNVDKKKIAIWGEGAGALMAAGVAMKLAKNNEADLVKVVIVDLPMLYAGWLEADPAKLNDV